MTEKRPAAFMSYVRLDDKHEDGRLTQFRERLEAEVRMQTGDPFAIFQDRNDIKWGENWKERIDESVDGATFLIPIITPSFFKSPPCRDELERFLKREKQLKRNDLILPVYYVGCPILDDPAKTADDKLAQVLVERQYADWRDLRFEWFTDPAAGKILARLAVQIRDALERTAAPRTPAARSRSQKAAAMTTRNSAAGQQLASPMQPSAESTATESGAAQSSARTEPPTRIVDAMHRGDHPTISEAIARADPGDRILIRPGLYAEALVIDKPLELVGDGAPGQVVVQAQVNSALLFKTTMGRIANLTFRQMSGRKHFALKIAQGCLELEDCDITSQSLSCVAILGGADPRLRRNRIHDGKQSGVLVYQNGQGTLEDNDIFGNAFAGVEIKTEGSPTLRRNRIHDGKQGGVYVHTQGAGLLEDNDIFGNASAGVEIKEASNPTLRRNRIYEGKQSGVYIHENGLGSLENNDIYENAYDGVHVRDGGKPLMRKNRIFKNGRAGIRVKDIAGGRFEKNILSDNAQGPWDISADSKRKIRRAHNEES